MPVSGLPLALENMLKGLVEENKLTSWRVTGGKHVVGVSLRFSTADITGPGVSGAVGHSYRSKPPSQKSRDTQRRNKWYENKQKEHSEGDVTIVPFQDESNFQTLPTGAKCRGANLGDGLKDDDIMLTQSPQSTDQNIQVKVVGMEPVGSAVNVVNVGKHGENTNSKDI